MILLIFSFLFLIDFSMGFSESRVNSSILPHYLESNVYKIGFWTKELNLQRCAIVMTGDGFCSLFLENEENGKTSEYFLGICQCDVLRKWSFCSPELTGNRQEDCSFKKKEQFHPSRVHRRLCDLTRIPELNEKSSCDCSKKIAGKQLASIDGFPTCYAPLLPNSICKPFSVCGVSKCYTEVIHAGIYKVHCSERCPGKQPFCEPLPLSKSSRHIKITSQWTNWSFPKCNASCGIGKMVSYSQCIDTVTKKPALDCLGPGTQCCNSDIKECQCQILTMKNQLILQRITGTCLDQSGCETKEEECEYSDDGLDDSFKEYEEY